jgi:ribosomal protein S18 acetylase RimI-like enzyme
MTPIGKSDTASAAIQIRLAAPEDAATIAAILYQSFVEYEPLYTRGGFAATTLNPPQVLARIREGPVWVASRGKEALGTVATVVKGDSLHIRGMAVLPSARRLHIGARLLEHIERQAAEQSCARVVLSTTPFLFSAIRLYEKFGFHRRNPGTHDLFGTPIFTLEKKTSRAI